MAVALDAGTTTVATTSSTGATTLSSATVITVGAGATLLVATLAMVPQGATSGPTGITMTWNSVSMTQQSLEQFGGASQPATAVIFTLVNPASGAKTLAASWTNTTVVYMGAISFTGTDTTTGVNASDNAVAGSSGTAQNLTVNSDVNGATVALYCNVNSAPTTNFNLIWSNQSLTPGAAATYQLGGSPSNTHTFSGASGSSFQAVAGVHVLSGTAIPGWRSPTAGPSYAI